MVHANRKNLFYVPFFFPRCGIKIAFFLSLNIDSKLITKTRSSTNLSIATEAWQLPFISFPPLLRGSQRPNNLHDIFIILFFSNWLNISSDRLTAPPSRNGCSLCRFCVAYVLSEIIFLYGFSCPTRVTRFQWDLRNVLRLFLEFIGLGRKASGRTAY